MHPNRIGIRAPNWLGDHIMALPFYRGLRRAYPAAELTLICRTNVSGMDEPADFKRHVLKHPFKLREEAKRLRQLELDLAISLPASPSSALLFFLAGIPQRIGFAETLAMPFLTHSRPWPGRNAGKHKSDLYLGLLTDLGADLDSTTPPKGTGPFEPRKKIMVAPGASIALRVWPYFYELLESLSDLYPEHEIEIVGSPNEAGIKYPVRHNIRNRIGQTSVSQLVDLCKHSDLVVTNDSGVAHVAATLANIRTVVLFGPGDPRYIMPRGDAVYPLHADGINCMPCESARCRSSFGHQACLKALPVERVLNRVCSILSSLRARDLSAVAIAEAVRSNLV